MNKIKAIVFTIIFIAACVGVEVLVSPVSIDEAAHHETVTEFYSLPENSIETLVVGASTALHGVIPVQLYRDYGISAYNMAMNTQTLIFSNTWIRETYKNHPDYLKNVILEVSSFGWAEEDRLHRAPFLEQKMSLEKLRMIKDYASDFEELVSILFPTVSYHTRWKELKKTDILNTDLAENYLGYSFYYNNVLANLTYDKIDIPVRELDPEATKEVGDFNRHYIESIISFCAENDINLIFYSTPRLDWTSAKHNVVQQIADKNHIKYIDFNFGEPFEELNFNMATDVYDSHHPGYYGAVKITDYLGKYLVENCKTTDVRGNEKFSFLDEESERFSRGAIRIELNDIADPTEYISYVNKMDDMAVVISVKGEAAESLTKAQREAFKQMGLNELAGLKKNKSYIGIIYNGKVLCDMTEPEASSDGSGSGGSEPLEYSENIGSGCIVVKSGGKSNGNMSSIRINGTEFSTKENGLNIAVYDKRSNRCVAADGFDTGTSAKRIIPHLEKYLDDYLAAGKDPSSLTGLPNQLYLYNTRFNDTKKARNLHKNLGESDLLKYIDTFNDSSNYSLIICANTSSKFELTPEIRKGLEERGLKGLAEKGGNDNYAGAVYKGKVMFDKLGKDGQKAGFQLFDVYAASDGEKLLINHKRTPLALDSDGLNVLVFNYKTQLVVDRVCFKSGENPKFAK